MAARLVYSPVTDEHILSVFNSCIKDMIDMDMMPTQIKNKVKLTQAPSTKWLGLATFNTCRVSISSYALKINDNEMKSIFYHELAHLSANIKDPGCGHTGLWKKYAEKITNITGIPVTRLTKITGEGAEIYRQARKQKKSKNTKEYKFECTHCGAKVIKKKACRFTKEYSWFNTDGTPHWCCRNCLNKEKKLYPFKQI